MIIELKSVLIFHLFINIELLFNVLKLQRKYINFIS